MSTFIHAKVACSSCGHVYDGDIAESLHISTRPDIRADILAGRFHRFTCPACGAETTIEKLLSYVDFARQHWFTVVPTVELPFLAEWRQFAATAFQQTMHQNCPPLVRDEIAPKMRQRLIFGLASLREKLIVMDAGLDDRVLEIVKLELVRERGLVPNLRLACHLVEVTADALVFDWAQPGPAPAGANDGDRAGNGNGASATVAPVSERITIDRIEYDRLAAHGADLAQRWPELWDDIAVDWRALFVPPQAAPAPAAAQPTETST